MQYFDILVADLIYLCHKPQQHAWCYPFISIWRITKGYCHSPHQKPFYIALTWGSWRQTCSFEHNNFNSDFRWCGCASSAHYRSTMKMMGCLQYGDVPHIWPSAQGTSSSYPWGSPMLFYHPSIGQGLQPPFLSLCDALLRYALWWTLPTPLLPYHFTYGRQSTRIGLAHFLLCWLEQT